MSVYKNIKYGFVGLACISLLSLQGCKDYFDQNANPNQVENPSLSSLLTTATQKAGLNSQRVAGFNAYYSQYLASPTQSSATDTYQITDNSSVWNDLYYALSDLYDFSTSAEGQGAVTHLGVAQVLTAYQLGLVADTWGSAPFSQALGKTDMLNPTYDSEESLYQAQTDLLDQAIANLQRTDATFDLDADADLIHHGDKTAWLETAYGLKARLLNKISKKSDYDPQAVLEALSHSYTSDGNEAGMATFKGVNPWAQAARNNANSTLDGWLSEHLVNQLNGKTYGIVDPRLTKITDPTVNGDYVGTRNGQGNVGGPNTTHDECYISENSPWTSADAPLYILTYAEIKFVEAEAAFRAGDKDRAYHAYLDGIRANMNKLQVTTVDQNSYIDDPSVSVGAANINLDLIFKEKYIATYLNPEAWNDIRRHNYVYKDFKLPVGSYLTDFIRRVAYPQDERSENGSNVPSEVSLDTPLWWDQP